jgi:hypothetical protein
LPSQARELAHEAAEGGAKAMLCIHIAYIYKMKMENRKVKKVLPGRGRIYKGYWRVNMEEICTRV